MDEYFNYIVLHEIITYRIWSTLCPALQKLLQTHVPIRKISSKSTLVRLLSHLAGVKDFVNRYLSQSRELIRCKCPWDKRRICLCFMLLIYITPILCATKLPQTLQIGLFLCTRCRDCFQCQLSSGHTWLATSYDCTETKAFQKCAPCRSGFAVMSLFILNA